MGYSSWKALQFHESYLFGWEMKKKAGQEDEAKLSYSPHGNTILGNGFSTLKNRLQSMQLKISFKYYKRGHNFQQLFKVVPDINDSEK